MYIELEVTTENGGKFTRHYRSGEQFENIQIQNTCFNLLLSHLNACSNRYFLMNLYLTFYRVAGIFH